MSVDLLRVAGFAIGVAPFGAVLIAEGVELSCDAVNNALDRFVWFCGCDGGERNVRFARESAVHERPFDISLNPAAKWAFGVEFEKDVIAAARPGLD